MIIDFHTHIFHEKIAEKAVLRLADISGYTPHTKATADDLLDHMHTSGVDLSVVLPVVTDPKQFDTILSFSLSVNERFFNKVSEKDTPRLLSLGGIHPMDTDMNAHITLLKNYGFKGIKLHPNYQGVKFSDIQYKRLLYKASELDLFVTVHTGFDPYTPDEEFCTTDMICEVVHEVAPKNLILAHMGNNFYPDAVEKTLCGLDVFFDTAFSLTTMDSEQFVRIVNKHGAHKILFATDSPWTNQKECIDIINATSLTKEQKEQLFYKNAKKLLRL